MRTVCSMPPTRASPPGYSAWIRRNCRDTSLAVAPSPAMRSGSRSTRISRDTPPTRETRPIPATEVNSRAMTRSTNQDNSVSDMLSEATVQVTMAPPAVVLRETMGSLASCGKSGRMRVNASRTSSSAALRSVPNRNSIIVVEMPSSTVERICSIPAMVVTASSTLRVTSDSSWVGATPP